MTEQATSTECSAQRWHITIEYDGGRFRGWQRHAHACTVQGTIEDALWRFCGERAEVCGAGRTDSGVHALAQSAHLDIVRKVESFRLRDGLNFHLRGSGVCILAAAHVPASFHARFSATQRIYMYRISNRRAPPCLDAQRLWFVPQRLCVERVREAARLLVGRHDFSSFRCVGCTSPSSVRTLDYVDIARQGEHVRMIFAARSFLYRQVRAMVGSLVWVGLKRWCVRDFANALALRRRSAAGPNAPACGLYLFAVRYPSTSAQGEAEQGAAEQGVLRRTPTKEDA